MKRFLVFCTILVVVVALGYMCVFFLTDNEKLNVNTTVYNINIGETRDLEYEHIKKKSTTTVSVVVEDDQVVTFDEETGKFTAVKGGNTTIRIETNNSNIAPALVEVNVGDGSYDYPYFIRQASDLASIGVESNTSANIQPFNVDDSYILTSNITLNGEWTPIKGVFSGTLFGEGYTISGLNITANGTNGGLFETIGATGSVQYLNIDNATINGSCERLGVIAGTNHGDIKNINILNANVTNTYSGGVTGAIVGYNGAYSDVPANISKCAIHANVTANGDIGGLVGQNKGGYIYNCYTKESASVTGQSSSASVGGLVGINEEKDSLYSVVKDCYNLANVSSASESLGAIVGKHNFDDSKNPSVINLVVGCYYLKEANDNALVGVHGYYDISASINQDDQFDAGVMGVQGKSMNDLRVQTTFVSHVSIVNGEDVSWDFNEAWILQSNSTPSINFEGANIKLSISSINVGGSNILRADDLLNLSMDGTYYIRQDIDLGGAVWTPLGAPNNGFRGLLSGIWLEDEQRYTKISNFVLDDGENVGFFNTISGGEVANLMFENVTTEEQNSGIDAVNFGIVAAVNNDGYIHNIEIAGTCSNVVNAIDKTAYVGGIVGVNKKGLVSECKVDAGLLKNFVNNYDVPTYVGGIAGANYDVVSNCAVVGGEIVRASTHFGAVGGIVGLNSKNYDGIGAVNSNYVTGAAIITNNSFTGKNNKHKYVVNSAGGIVGYHEGERVNYNLFDAEVSGFAVGGIVGTSHATIYENQTTRNSLMVGCLVGGITCFLQGAKGVADVHDNRIEGVLKGIDYSGTPIETHEVVMHISGTNTIKCGLLVGGGGESVGNSTRVAAAYNNFVSVEFVGVGTNFKSINTNAKPICPEYYNNVFNKDLMKDTFSHWWNTIQEFILELYGAGTWEETVVSENDLTSTSFKYFKEQKFSDAIWNLDFTLNSGFPTLYNVVKLPESVEA